MCLKGVVIVEFISIADIVQGLVNSLYCCCEYECSTLHIDNTNKIPCSDGKDHPETPRNHRTQNHHNLNQRREASKLRMPNIIVLSQMSSLILN
jgi:hypothetical protein